MYVASCLEEQLVRIVSFKGMLSSRNMFTELVAVTSVL